jgi:hypothetical protein
MIERPVNSALYSPGTLGEGFGRPVPSYGRARTSGLAFDGVSQGGRQGVYAQTFAEGEASASRALEPAAQYLDEPSYLGGNASSSQFMAQQIAQELIPEHVFSSPQQAATAAVGSYLAAPASRVSYDGPYIALDITV